MENGKKYLNISTVRAMPWNDLPQEWGKNFPWLAEFLDTCWADPVRLQRDYFFAWWQRFYMGAVWDSMSNGQALFLAGPVGRGKTLLTAIVTKAMGGSVDAGEFILGNTQFNKELFETGLWIVDDGVASNDPRLHKRYSELLKKVVANSTFNYMPKFRDAIKVPWKGRVIIALNDNDAGIGMIPLLEPSIEDKLMILRFSDALRRFPESADLGSIIDRELPYFLRWLSDWVMPEELRGESRFGCKSYIHPEIRVKAMNSGGLSDVIDIIKLWIKRHCAGNCRGPYWLGTAAEFMIELTGDEDIRPLVSKFSPQSLGRKLSQAADIYPELVSRDTTSQHKGDGGHYRICLAGDVEALPVSGVAVKFEPEDLEQIAA